MLISIVLDSISVNQNNCTINKGILSIHNYLLSGELQAVVKYFNVDYETLFTITDDVIQYRTDNVKIPGGSDVTLEGKEMLPMITWETLVNKVKGESKDIEKGLRNMANLVYKDISEDTARRLKDNVHRLEEAKRKLISGMNESRALCYLV